MHKQQQQQLGQRSSSIIAIGLYVPCRYPLPPLSLSHSAKVLPLPLTWGTGAADSFRFQLSFGMLQLSSANYSYTYKCVERAHRLGRH